MSPHKLTLIAVGCGLSMAAAPAIDRPVSQVAGTQASQETVAGPSQIQSKEANIPVPTLPKPDKAGQVRLGIIPGEVPQLVRAQLAMSGYPGIVVESTEPGGPAQKAGLQDFDIILKIDDISISGTSALKEALKNKKPGDQVKIQYLRGGKKQEGSATLEESRYGDLPEGDPSANGTMHNQIDRAIGAGRRPLKGASPLNSMGAGGPMDRVDPIDILAAMAGLQRADDPMDRIDHLRSMMNQRMGMTQPGNPPPAAPGNSQGSVQSNSFSSSTSVSDAEGTIRITNSSQGGTRIYATDPNGKLQFEGPYNTAAEKANVPPEIRKRLDNLNISFDVR